jgi:Putative quorum-sensing-regulated virulence factor
VVAGSAMRMPFGKYRGVAVEELPLDYLRWLRENIALREPLLSSVNEALAGKAEDRPLGSSGVPVELKPVVSDLIATGYRALALKVHPDCGGNHEDMTKLNRACEWLRSVLQ